MSINIPKNILSMVFLTLYLAVMSNSHANSLKPYKGLPLPAFVLPGLSGQEFALDDQKGQVVLVNFWATGCPPCVKEMPSMQRLEESLSGRPFKLIAVNIGEDPDEIKEFLQRINVELTVVVDGDGTVTRSWGLFAYPTTFLLDSQGHISQVVYGEVEWDSAEVVALIESLMPESAKILK